MAKDKKNDNQQADSDKSDDLQVPEKPKKRQGGDVNIIALVGIIGGTVLFMIIVVFALYWFFIRPDIIGTMHGGDSTAVHQAEKKELTPEEEEKEKMRLEMEKLAEVDAISETDGALFIQTPDIIANTNPPNYFVVVQLGIEFRLPETEGAAPAEGHGGGGGGHSLEPKLMSEVSSFVTKFIGSRSIEQISTERDSLEFKFREELKPIFVKHKVFLRKITLPKFIMQSA